MDIFNVSFIYILFGWKSFLFSVMFFGKKNIKIIVDVNSLIILESIIKQHPNAKNLINTKNKEILKNANRFSNVQSLIIDKNKEIEHSINNKNNIYVKKNVGFWTNLVLGNKLSNIIDTAKSMNANNEGFWTNLVLANRRSRERGDISRGK